MNLYRFEENWAYGDKVELYLREFNVLKETPNGYWIHDSDWQRKRWVSKTSRKRFAYPEKEMAFNSFKARKRMQIKILKKQLERAELAITLTPENAIAYNYVFTLNDF